MNSASNRKQILFWTGTILILWLTIFNWLGLKQAKQQWKSEHDLSQKCATHFQAIEELPDPESYVCERLDIEERLVVLARELHLGDADVISSNPETDLDQHTQNDSSSESFELANFHLRLKSPVSFTQILTLLDRIQSIHRYPNPGQPRTFESTDPAINKMVLRLKNLELVPSQSPLQQGFHFTNWRCTGLTLCSVVGTTKNIAESRGYDGAFTQFRNQ